MVLCISDIALYLHNSVNVGGVMVLKLCTLSDHTINLNHILRIYLKGL